MASIITKWIGAPLLIFALLMANKLAIVSQDIFHLNTESILAAIGINLTIIGGIFIIIKLISDSKRRSWMKTIDAKQDIANEKQDSVIKNVNDIKESYKGVEKSLIDRQNQVEKIIGNEYKSLSKKFDEQLSVLNEMRKFQIDKSIEDTRQNSSIAEHERRITDTERRITDIEKLIK